VKTHEQIEQAFIQAVGKPKTATQATVDKACQTVLQKATDEFGPGIYVKGLLNVDMQGINFTYKRPAIRERRQFFVPCHVEVAIETQDDTGDTLLNATTQESDDDKTGSTEDAPAVTEEPAKPAAKSSRKTKKK
jgi:hypothetical protein